MLFRNLVYEAWRSFSPNHALHHDAAMNSLKSLPIAYQPEPLNSFDHETVRKELPLQFILKIILFYYNI